MAYLSLSSRTVKHLSIVVFLGMTMSLNSVFADDQITNEIPVVDVQITDTTTPEVSPIISDILPPASPDVAVPQDTKTVVETPTEEPKVTEEISPIVAPSDIPFADTPALEPETTEEPAAPVPESLSIPLFGEASGMAAYNTNTGELIFTTYLEQDSFDLSDGLFTKNGEYVLFRTNDSNWCSGLSLDECRATSIQQATVSITNIIEPTVVDEKVTNEILSVEQGEPAGEGDILSENMNSEVITPVVVQSDTSSVIESHDIIPTDTNTYVPPVTEILDELLSPPGETVSDAPVVTEEISPTVSE